MPCASAPEMFDASYHARASSMLSFLYRITTVHLETGVTTYTLRFCLKL
jgi:hypothetical protein